MVGYDDTLILFKLRSTFGVDLAFLASKTNGPGRLYRPVVIQLKNSGAAFSEMLLTLSPGLQFECNDVRRRLLGSSQDGKAKKRAKTDQGESEMSTQWLSFGTAHPDLAKDWIRVSVTIRSVSSDI